MRRARCAPTECNLCLPDVAGPFAIAESADAFFIESGVALRLSRWKRSVLLAYRAQRFVGVDVADDGEHGVARMIEVAIEADERVACQCAKPGLTTDAPPADAVMVVEQLVQRFRRDRAGIVRLALRF